MRDYELKQEFTINDICAICEFNPKTFYAYKKLGKIPPADDTERQPHVWYRSTILPSIEWYLELRAARIAKRSKLTKP